YCEARPVRTRQRRIAAVIDNIDELRESIGESICAIRFVEPSISGFEPQVTILDEGGNFVARTDFANESDKVIAEFDGAGKYYIDGTAPNSALALTRCGHFPQRNPGSAG